MSLESNRLEVPEQYQHQVAMFLALLETKQIKLPGAIAFLQTWSSYGQK